MYTGNFLDIIGVPGPITRICRPVWNYEGAGAETLSLCYGPSGLWSIYLKKEVDTQARVAARKAYFMVMLVDPYLVGESFRAGASLLPRPVSSVGAKTCGAG